MPSTDQYGRTVSDDGRYVLQNNQWVPNVPLSGAYPGTPVQLNQFLPPGAAPRNRTNLALGLGIGSMIGWIIPLIGLPLSISGIMFSSKAMKQYPSGKATVAFVLSILGLVFSGINFAWGFVDGFTKAAGH